MDKSKEERLEDERPAEQREGLAARRRGTSDQPEGELPHPQDVNEIGEGR